jgi:hypothetical protein
VNSLTDNNPEALLVRCEAAERALAEAQTIIEVKGIRDQAEALRQCARIAGFGLEYQNWVAEIKIRAERRAGEMLEELVPSTGGRPRKNLDTVDGFAPPSTLAELGITYYQSRRWRLEASVPEEDFNRYVASVLANGDELTSAGLLCLAEELKYQKQKDSSTEAEPAAARRKSATGPSAWLYQDEWLALWDAELEDPHFIGHNTLALVVTNGVKSRRYLLEAVQGFIVTPIRK